MHPSPQQSVHAAMSTVVDAIRNLIGVRFGDLESFSAAKDVPFNKAVARLVIERHVSGLDALERAYGVSIKTLALSVDSLVLWPTKIVGIDFEEVARRDFHRSTVGAMLRHVLFLPVCKPDKRVVEDWSLEGAFTWSPVGHELGQLDADYEEIRDLILARRADDLSSSQTRGQGRWLMPKTSGTGNHDIVRFVVAGKRGSARRRAFFLRESLTQALLERSR